MTWKKIAGETWSAVVLSALLYLAVLYVTREFHLSSNAFKFFALCWLAQSAMMVFQAWRRSRSVAFVGTSVTDDIPLSSQGDR